MKSTQPADLLNYLCDKFGHYFKDIIILIFFIFIFVYGSRKVEIFNKEIPNIRLLHRYLDPSSTILVKTCLIPLLGTITDIVSLSLNACKLTTSEGNFS